MLFSGDLVRLANEVLEDMFDVLQDKLNERQEHRRARE